MATFIPLKPSAEKPDLLTNAMIEDIIDRVFVEYYKHHQADLLIPTLQNFEEAYTPSSDTKPS